MGWRDRGPGLRVGQSPIPRTMPHALALLAFLAPQAPVVKPIDVNETSVEFFATDPTSGTSAYLHPLMVPAAEPVAAKIGDATFFVATTPKWGREVFRTTGQAGSTRLLLDIAAGELSSDPMALSSFGGQVVFLARPDDDALEDAGLVLLYRSNGFSAGTAALTWPGDPLAPLGFLPSGQLTRFADGRIVLRGEAADGNEYLYAVDPSLGTYARLLPVPVDTNGFGHVKELAVDAAGTKVAAMVDFNGVPTLITTDGTAGGTQIVRAFDLALPPHDAFWSMKLSRGLESHNGGYYFPAFDAAVGWGLWRSDGTANGTVCLRTFWEGDFINTCSLRIDRGGAAGNELYFQYERVGEFSGIDDSYYEIWRTDGTVAGTQQVQGEHFASLARSRYVSFSGALYYISVEPNGAYLRKVEPGGGASVTKVVPETASYDKYPELLPYNPDGLFVANGRLYFTHYDAQTGVSLRSTDGVSTSFPIEVQTAGVERRMAFDVVSFTNQGDLVAIGRDPFGMCVVTRAKGATGMLDLQDRLPKDVGTYSSYPEKFTAFGAGRALFVPLVQTAPSPAPYSSQPWILSVDGTAEPLVPPGTPFEVVGGFTVGWTPAGLRGYFAGREGSAGVEVWETDGTAAGTALIADLTPGSADTEVIDSLVFGGQLLLVVHRPGIDPVGVGALLAWDGANLVQLTSADAKGELEQVGDVVLFAAKEPATGLELWRTDGTLAGTTLVLDANPGSKNTAVKHITSFGTGAILSLNDGVHGGEPWVTDGTAAGTQLVVDVTLGATSSQLEWILGNDQAFYFLSKGTIHRSDFTAAGTLPIPLPAGTLETNDYGPNVFDGWLYFPWKPQDPLVKAPFLRTNGSLTEPVPDGNAPGEVLGAIQDLVVSGVHGYSFPVGSSGWEPYAMGATPTLIADTAGKAQAFPYYSTYENNPGRLAVVGEHLVFAQENPLLGIEPYVLALPGPLAHDLGLRGIGAAHLAATPPKLGGSMTVTAKHGPLGGVSLLAYGAPLDDPLTGLAAPTSAAWLDPLTATIAKAYSGGALSLTLALPASPALAGVSLNAQVWHVAVSGAAPTTSNGLRLKLAF